MAPVRGVYRRPLLDLPRALVHGAAEDLPVWHDPHNVDPAYARSRVRALLPTLEEAAGGGLVAGLARTAALLRADAELLDSLAAELHEDASADGGLTVRALADAHRALRGRVLRRWAIELGAPPGTLSAAHVDALDALVTRWRGQGSVHLPGGIRIARVRGALRRDDRLP